MQCINGLKKINDTYGHEEGDIYIRETAHLLEKACRRGELLTRYGGDEFVILLIDYAEEDIKEYISRIHEDIEKYNRLSMKEYRMDASIGYHVETDAAHINLEKIIEIADQNMYAVKKAKKASRK